MKEFCTIEDIAVMTGLTTRTIRSYLANGQLDGEKIDGVWQFTAEQFSAFLAQDMVRQSVRAKENGKIYDFLLTDQRRESSACLIWDWPVETEEEEQALRERLMERINRLGLECSYHHERKLSRVILLGSPNQIGEFMKLETA